MVPVVLDNVKITHGSLSVSESETIDNTRIYPNPTSNLVYIDGKLNVNKIDVYSIDGKKLNTVSNSKLVDLSIYMAGTYIIVVETDKGQFSRKIIKK